MGAGARRGPRRSDGGPPDARGHLPAADRRAGSPGMSRRAVFAHQFRSDLERFWRNPQSRYFTLLMPIVFLAIFATIFKGTTIVDGHRIKITTFYVPGIMAL